MVGAAVISMTAAQGVEFYVHLRGLFVDKLKPLVRDHLREALSSAFGFQINEEIYDQRRARFKLNNCQDDH